MQKKLLLAILLISSTSCFAQLKTTPVCPTFSVDILDGKINELNPASTVTQVKEKFPCFTSSENEGTTGKCGSFAFYKDKGIYFYTGRDYIEIQAGFKGKLSIPLLGANRNSLFKWLGHPQVKDVNWDAFQMAYGTLVLYYKAGKVNKLQITTLGTNNIQLCE